MLALGGMSSAQAQTRNAEKKTTASESKPASKSSTNHSGESDAPRSNASHSESSTNWHAPGHLLDSSEQRRAHQIAITLNIPWWFWGTFPLSISARYHLPIVHNGFIPAVNEWFGLELGADFTAWFAGTRLGGSGSIFMFSLPVEAFWAFRILPTLAAYVKAGFGLEFIFYPSWAGSGYYYSTWGLRDYSGFHFSAHPIFQHGIMWNFSESVNLRAEVGYPHIVSIGIGFHLF